MNFEDITEPPRDSKIITKIEDGSITMDDGWSLGVPAEALSEMRVHDRVYLWGRGIGYPIRGVATRRVVAWYRTEDEQEAFLAQEIEESHRKQRERYAAAKRELAAQYDALPDVFKRRVDGLRARGGPNWSWKYEAYELFCCTEACKIIASPESPIGLSDEHSGNTIGVVKMLATLHAQDPELVVIAHGAMCPLVGCSEYGCAAAGASS